MATVFISVLNFVIVVLRVIGRVISFVFKGGFVDWLQIKVNRMEYKEIARKIDNAPEKVAIRKALKGGLPEKGFAKIPFWGFKSRKGARTVLGVTSYDPCPPEPEAPITHEAELTVEKNEHTGEHTWHSSDKS